MPIFHKIDQKASEGIMSDLHFTTLANIPPKSKYFVGRIYIKVG